ncbi:MAG: ZIP family metal transporter [Actinomycetota bacterium]|nr:ZIP family metal transporter [Actinomycetota bacterium]
MAAEMADGQTWAFAMIALAVLSCVSLFGSVTMMLRADRLRRSLVVLVPFAAGALLGDAFLHIVPEVAESPSGFDRTASLSVVSGIVAFFILEKVLHWHHSHFPHEEVIHPVAVSNVVGDGLHNFIDGVIVAGAFAVSPQLGIATTAAVGLHELPQELGDFGILIHAGVRPRRALLLNFLSGLTALVGGAATLLLSTPDAIVQFFLPFTAGTFVYIASTDLIPELHKEPEPAKSLLQVAALLAGVGVMGALLYIE